MPAATDTRQRLIEAAAELFWERGYAATGLSDILESAGARGGSLYHFFPSKDDLLLAVIEHHARVLLTSIENALASVDTAADKAPAIIAFYRRFMSRTGCTLGCPMTNLSAEVADTHIEAARRIAAFNEHLAAVVAEGFRDASPERPEHAAWLGNAAVCMMQGALLQARAAKSEAPLEACAVATRLLTGAFRAEHAPGIGAEV